MKTLYVHAGLPKTATTSIQRFCYDNRTLLEKKGYCYPQFPWKYQIPPTKRNAMFLYKEVFDENGKRLKEEEDRRREESFRMIGELFQTYDNVILSDEILWHAVYKRRKTLWKDLYEAGKQGGFTVKVIVYLRRQDEYVSSWWNQLIKAGAGKPPTGFEVMPWEEYRTHVPKGMNVDYYPVLENAATVLGKENIIVRRFQRSSFIGGRIQADFLWCLGLELTEEYEVAQEFSNLKLSGNTPEIKRVVNTIPNMSRTENSFFRSVLLECSVLSEKSYPCSMFSAEEAKDFVAQFEEGNRKISEEYLGESGEPLFSMSFPETEKWEKENPYMEEDLIRFVGESSLFLLRKIEENQKKLEEENAELKKALKELHKLKETLRHPLRTLVWFLFNRGR